MRRVRVAFPGILLCVILLVQAPLRAADDKPAPDLASFGKLPVRFNGRVVTWDHVARSHLLRVSGRDHLLDDNGRRLPAIVWLLDAAGSGKNLGRRRVFPVSQPKLVKLLGLQVPRGGAPPGDEDRFSGDDLAGKGNRLQQEAQRAAARPAPLRDDFDRAVLDLADRMYATTSLVNSLRHPPAAGRGNAEGVAEARREVYLREMDPVPLVVPPRRPDAPWRTLARGIVDATDDRVQGKDPAEENAFVLGLVTTLVNYADNDAAAFDRGTAGLWEAVKALPFDVTRGPFDFTLPAGWVEAGAQANDWAFLYADTRSRGHAVCRIETGTGLDTQRPYVRIDHFPGDTAPLEDVVNWWRFNQRLLPVAPAEALRTHVTKLKVGDEQAPYVDITGAPGPRGEKAERSLSVIVRRGGHTFVASIFGETDAVAREKEAFDSWAKSLRFGEPEKLSAWFRIEDGQAGPQRTLAALLKGGGRVWCLRLAHAPAALEPLTKPFEQIAQTLRLAPAEPGGARGPVLAWDLPKHCEVMEGDQRSFATIFVGAEGELGVPMEVVAVTAAEGASLVPLLNLFRAQAGLPPADESHLGKPDVARRVQVNGREVLLIDARPPAPANP